MTYHTQYRIWQNSLYSLGRIARRTGMRYYLPATLVLLCHLVMPVAIALFLGAVAAGYVPFWLYLLLPLLAGSLLCLPFFSGKALTQFRLLDTDFYEKFFSFSYAYIHSREGQNDLKQGYTAQHSGFAQGIELMIQASLDFLQELFFFIFLLICIYALSLRLGTNLLGIFFFFFLTELILHLFASHSEQKQNTQASPWWRQLHKRYSPLITGAITANQGLFTIRTYLLMQIHRYSLALKELYAIRYAYSFVFQALLYIIQVLKLLTVFLWLYDTAASPFYLVFTLTLFTLYSRHLPLTWQHLTALRNVNPSITAFRNFLKEPDHAILTGQQPVSDTAHCFKLENVSFSYAQQTQPTLHSVSFNLYPGEKIAIIGPHASGKTTLLLLLSGLLTPTSGRIEMDGQEISCYQADSYYRHIDAIFANEPIFAFSIAENISCLPPEKTDRNRVWKCLALVGLSTKVRSLPHGIDTACTQSLDLNGVNFSSGETQKLLLARALYKDADVLLFDDSMTSLDPLAERAMYQTYTRLFSHKTCVFASNHLKVVPFCDRILFLQNGRIIEEGTHEALLKLGGAYAEIYHKQENLL